MLILLTTVKHLQKALTTYIVENCGQAVLGGSRALPDLKAIAEDSSPAETNKLLKLCLFAAINSPSAEEYIIKIQNELSDETKMAIKDAIEEMTNVESSPENSPPRKGTKPDEASEPNHGASVDNELYLEEQLSQMMAELEKVRHEKNDLEEDLRDLHDRLGRLTETNESLRKDLATTEDQLEKFRSRDDSGVGIKVLNEKLHAQEDLIASQEDKLKTSEATIEDLQKKNATLTLKSQKTQKLQDEYDMIKIERDQLSKKANAADKYVQKLKSMQNIEKERRQLEEEVKQLNERLLENDKHANNKSVGSGKSDAEYKQILTSIERELLETTNMKKQIEFDYQALKTEYDLAKQQQVRDQEEISELHDRIQGSGSGDSSPSTPKATNHDAQFDRKVPQL
jgi:protein HOOK3